MRAWFACILMAGCATTTPSSPSAAPSAEDAASKVIAAQYNAIERGALAEWGAHFADDALLIGTDAGEVFRGRASILEHVSAGAAERMKPDVKRTYRSTKQHVGVAPDRRSAWVTDEIDYQVVSPEKSQSFFFRMTSMLAARDDGTWEILASCYSIPNPDLSPAPVPKAIESSIGPGAEPIAERVKSDGAAVSGGIAAKLAPGGHAGWVAYNATLPSGAGKVPVRVFAIFIEENGTWKKAQEHVSVAVPD